ncbi:ABC transporter substrate-binding protein [Roseomonas sp. NAR14]|uniref:ABC transporter substrate-binding protein n=1 Tax=Roseomonas acroporae TaxID=2937791 RepID=A0A9X1Y9V5_9PROT|nr:ABC transporter substrate-binding protein [Roseomonas acroporae]MCK8785755.1 ABC transporter substrate-binding protein [Roseomonas acroporae]
MTGQRPHGIGRRGLPAAAAAWTALPWPPLPWPPLPWATRPARAAAGRVVCIGAALTECVFALGEGPHLVARDSSSRFPAAALALPDIGYMRALPPEGIASLSPDLVILSEEAGPAEAVAVLRATGLPMRTLPDGAGPGAAEAKLRGVGAALGRDAEPVARQVAADWAMLDAPLAGLRARPRVLFVLSLARGAPLVSGEGTHADAAIAAAGGVNPVRGWRGYRPLSAESAATLAPDVILMMDFALQEAGGAAAVFATPALAVTPAARAGRVVALDGGLMLGFGPRAAHGRRALAALLHPDAALPPLPERPWTAA